MRTGDIRILTPRTIEVEKVLALLDKRIEAYSKAAEMPNTVMAEAAAAG